MHRTHPAILLLTFALPFSAPAAAPPAGPDEALIDRCDYPDDAAAARAWAPMKGSPPAAVGVEGGTRALRLRCPFAGTDIERASWDRAVRLDLSACRGIQFRVLARALDPISHFSLYLRSGAGWYSASFHPEAPGRWTTVSIDKAHTSSEGQPDGWGKIEAIRLSAWRGTDVDTELFVADLRRVGQLGAGSSIALVRNDAGDEARLSAQLTERIAALFASAGLDAAVLSESDATPARLRAARLIVLPHNPRMAGAAAEAIARHVGSGAGKVIACYSVPPPLRPLLGITDGAHVKEPRPGHFASIVLRPGALPGAPSRAVQHSWNVHSWKPVAGAGEVLAGWNDEADRPTGEPAILASANGMVITHILTGEDEPAKRRLLLAMAGRLVPTLWRAAAEAALESGAARLDAPDFDAAAARVQSAGAGRPAAQNALEGARAARAEGKRLLARKQYPEAVEKAEESARLLLEAWCRAQQPVPNEFRAFWCHDAYGVKGMTWEEAIARLAANGFTAIVPNMLWGGVAFYPSAVLPVAQRVKERGDAIAECLAACRKHGLAVHVWKVNWNLGHAVPASFVERMRAEGRLQRRRDGEEATWLCPSHPKNRQLEIDSMIEVARQYAVDGLHFDYIRYPGADSCFCDGCRERFLATTGAAAISWPKDVLRGGPLHGRWLDWRRANIDALVEAVARQGRALRPGLKISAAVFRNWAADRDGVGQDWKLWCKRGWLDFVCPMDYTHNHALFERSVARQVDWAGSVPCYPGIGASASSSRLGVPGVIRQIGITRAHRTGGFIIFNYGTGEAGELVPQLGLGITAPR